MTAVLETDIALEKTPLERYVPPAKPSLVGLTRAALAEALGAIGVAPSQQQDARAAALALDLCARRAETSSQMTSVSKELHARARCALHAGAARGRGRAGFGRRHAQVAAAAARRSTRASGRTRSSASTSRKPTAARLCVSSQVGCTLTCSFCHTGTQRLVRNLTPGEIVGQVMVARDRLGDFLGMRARARRRPADRRRPLHLQHRDDGHGRAALQFRGGARRARRGAGRRRPRRSPSAASRCRPPAWCR